MVQGKVEICGVNTAKLPLLKNAEKEALFERITAGDMQARQIYIEGNLRLVLSVIKRRRSITPNLSKISNLEYKNIHFFKCSVSGTVYQNRGDNK